MGTPSPRSCSRNSSAVAGSSSTRRTRRSRATNPSLKSQACGARFRISGRDRTLAARGSVGVEGAEGPEPEPAEIERDPDRVADHCEVELGAQYLGTDDAGEEGEPAQRGAGVDVSQSGDDRQR